MGFRNKDQSLLHSGVNATISKLITVTFQLPRLKNCLWLCDAELSFSQDVVKSPPYTNCRMQIGPTRSGLDGGT